MSQNRTYECHITISPVEGERLELFYAVAARFRFKVAKLLMQKTRQETLERSNKDSFCTGHSTVYMDMETRMFDLVHELQELNFQVWRYKIEEILLDVRL